MATFELLNDKKYKYLQYKFSLSACISGVTVAIACLRKVTEHTVKMVSCNLMLI